MKVKLTKIFTFEAAHRLPCAGDEHKCSKTHGHSYKVEITVKGEIDSEKGWFMDYSDIKSAWKPIGEILDHCMLNDLEGLSNPTSELLAVWIWHKLEDKLPGLHAVTIHETATSRCTYKGE